MLIFLRLCYDYEIHTICGFLVLVNEPSMRATRLLSLFVVIIHNLAHFFKIQCPLPRPHNSVGSMVENGGCDMPLCQSQERGKGKIWLAGLRERTARAACMVNRVVPSLCQRQLAAAPPKNSSG